MAESEIPNNDGSEAARFGHSIIAPEHKAIFDAAQTLDGKEKSALLKLLEQATAAKTLHQIAAVQAEGARLAGQSSSEFKFIIETLEENPKNLGTFSAALKAHVAEQNIGKIGDLIGQTPLGSAAEAPHAEPAAAATEAATAAKAESFGSKARNTGKAAVEHGKNWGTKVAKLAHDKPLVSTGGAAGVTALMAALWPNKSQEVPQEDGTTKTESKWSAGKITAVSLGTAATVGAGTAKLWAKNIAAEAETVVKAAARG